MIKRYGSESGYSLLIVLMVITVISIIGLMLMGMTVNSIKHVSINEDSIRNKTETDIAIEEAMAQIDEAIEKMNDEIRIKSLPIDTVISKVNFDLNHSITSLGTHPYTIQSVTIKDGSDGVYQEKVTIQAPIGSTGKFATKTVLISSINNVFKYSTVTPGNLTINGAAYLEGDIRIGGNLETSNYGKYITTFLTFPIPHYVKTSFPAINGNLTVLGKLKRISTFSLLGNPIFLDFLPTSTELEKYFSVTPKLRANSLQVEPIDVTSLVQGKSGNLPRAKTMGNLTIPKNTNSVLIGNYVINNSLVMEAGSKLTVKGSIRVKGNASLSGNLMIENPEDYLYIEGDSSKPVAISDLDFSGQMYIGHSLNINNNLNTNGTIYVNGQARVENFTNTNPGTLLLIANGDIDVANNNLYNDEPKPINAFFYSNSTLEIYGIGSHLKITGGIYGNNIILNAVKGKTTEASNGDLIFENNQDALSPTASRLSIIYKKDLILNPPTGIPASNELSIENIDLEYEN